MDLTSPTAAEDRALIQRELLAASYFALELIGRGGFHQVWAAVALEAGEIQVLCALKIFSPSSSSRLDPRMLQERLFSEARILAHLNRVGHPNLLGIQNVFRTPHLLCVRMDYIDGIELSKLLTHRKSRSRGPVPVDVALALTADAASGLGAAHAATDMKGRPLKLLHLDVKPANLILNRTGTLKVIDFGISSLRDQVSSPEFRMGTPQYMAPEQINDNACPASDLYSLGLVLYELLTLKPLIPWNQDPMMILDAAEIVDPRPSIQEVRQLSSEAADVLEMLLQRDPTHRVGDGQQVADTIHRLLGNRRPVLREFYEHEYDKMWELDQKLLAISSETLLSRVPDTLELGALFKGAATLPLARASGGPTVPAVSLSSRPATNDQTLQTAETSQQPKFPLESPVARTAVEPRRFGLWAPALLGITLGVAVWQIMVSPPAFVSPAAVSPTAVSSTAVSPAAPPAVASSASVFPAEVAPTEVEAQAALSTSKPVSSMPQPGAPLAATSLPVQSGVSPSPPSTHPAQPTHPPSGASPGGKGAGRPEKHAQSTSAESTAGTPPSKSPVKAPNSVPGATTGQTTKATAGTCSTLRILDPRGRGILRAQFEALPDDLTVLCGPSAVEYFSLTEWHLKPGDYRVRATREDGTPLDHRFTIRAGQTCTVQDTGVSCQRG